VTGRKPPPVNLAQGPDQCIAVLVADFAILVAMSIVGIRHCFSPASLCSGEQHLRNRTGWQLPFAVLSRTRPYKKRAPYLLPGTGWGRKIPRPIQRPAPVRMRFPERLRRIFVEQRPVVAGKPAEVEEAVLQGNFRDRRCRRIAVAKHGMDIA